MFKWLTDLFAKEKSKNAKPAKTYKSRIITVKEFVDGNLQEQIKEKTIKVFEKRSWKTKPSWDDMVVYVKDLGLGYHRFRYVNIFGEIELMDDDELVVMNINRS